MVIMCLLGGWFNFMGPMTGAAIVILIRTFASALVEFLVGLIIRIFGTALSENIINSLKKFAGEFPSYWTLVLGVICVLVIFFVPNGVLGYFDELKNRKRAAACSGTEISAGE
jgi:branched-chain amino acid transport system permease protein